MHTTRCLITRIATIHRNEQAAAKAPQQKHIKANEVVVVEAHLVDPQHAARADGVLKASKKGSLRTAPADQDVGNQGNVAPEDTLLGRVVIHTDVRMHSAVCDNCIL